MASVTVLDVKGTHVRNPNCPMRLAQDPQGRWYCVDCGFHVMWKRMRIILEEANGPEG